MKGVSESIILARAGWLRRSTLCEGLVLGNMNGWLMVEGVKGGKGREGRKGKDILIGM